jgi:hypothetical protein
LLQITKQKLSLNQYTTTELNKRWFYTCPKEVELEVDWFLDFGLG